jgi:hypothetical protein
MKHFIYIIISVLPLILFSSCETIDYYREYETRTTYDEFEDNQRNSLLWNYIESDNESYGSEWVLNFGIVQYKHKNSAGEIFNIEIVYGGSKWINIVDDKSLTLLIDSKKYYYDAKKIDKETRVSKGWDLYQERAVYPISKEELYKIANAKSVRVKLQGQDFYVKGYFVEKNFSNLKRFLKEFDSK